MLFLAFTIAVAVCAWFAGRYDGKQSLIDPRMKALEKELDRPHTSCFTVGQEFLISVVYAHDRGTVEVLGILNASPAIPKEAHLEFEALEYRDRQSIHQLAQQHFNTGSL